MSSVIPEEARNAPQQAERLNGAGSFDLPMSAISQPIDRGCRSRFLCRLIAAYEHCRSAAPNCGLTIKELPTELKALTRRASANSRWFDQRLTQTSKAFSTPLRGGEPAIGFVASITGLPATFAMPATAARLAPRRP